MVTAVFFLQLRVTLAALGALGRAWRRPRPGMPMAALLALLATGCGGSEPEHRGNLALSARLIEAEPTATFDELADSVHREVFRASFAGRSDLQDWEVEEFGGASKSLVSAVVPLRDGTLLLPPALSRDWYVFPLRRLARDLSGFRVHASGWQAGDLVTLCWADRHETFLQERCLWQLVQAPRAAPDVFHAAAHPRWRGHIERMKVQLTTRAGRHLAFRGVTGFQIAPATADPEEPRRVELDRVTRNAWVKRAGARLSRLIDVPAGGILRVGYGLSPAAGGPVTFRLRARSPRAVTELHADRIDPSSRGYRPAWRTVEVDLAALGHGQALLEFETEPLPGAVPRGHTFWADPTILAPAPTRRTSVLLISVDTLRADRLSLYGHDRPTSARLSEWARRSAVVFENAVSAAPWTLPSHVSLFSGVYPFRHGVTVQGPVPTSLPLLAERFRAAGYSTAASVLGPLLTPAYGLARGFDTFDVRGELSNHDHAVRELEQGIEETLEWLDRHGGEPFFYFLHTYEPHSPYLSRQPYFRDLGMPPFRGRANTNYAREGPAPGHQSRFRFVHEPDLSRPDQTRDFGPGDKPVLDALYDSGVAYADAQLGRLLDHVEETSLAKNLTVVITSDHGESFYDHGLVGHHHLYDDNLLVPLVIAAPGAGGRPGRVAAQVRTVDVVPTLLELAGLDPLPALDGASLVPLLRGEDPDRRVAWAYVPSSGYGIAVRHPRGSKYILHDSIWDPIRGTHLLFDLRRDPGELRPLEQDVAPLRRRILRELERSVPGPRIRFWNNRDDDPLAVSLQGAPVSPEALTSPDLGFSCCRWAPPRGVTIEVPPGRSFTLLLQDRRQGEVTLTASLGRSAPPFVESLDLARLERPVTAVYDRGRWRAGGPADETAASTAGWTAVLFGRHSRGPAGGPSPGELQEGLRALGYIQ